MRRFIRIAKGKADCFREAGCLFLLLLKSRMGLDAGGLAKHL